MNFIYRVTLDTPEQAERFVADPFWAANDLHCEVDGSTVEFHNGGWRHLRSLTGDDDGFIEDTTDGPTMWVGGMAYPINRQEH